MEFGTVEYNQMYGRHDNFEASQAAEPRGGSGSGSGAYSQSRNAPSRDARRQPHGYVAEPSRYGYGRQGPKYRKGLLGLSNLGNTCFMNSALQCLTHTHGLQKYFRHCNHAYTSKGQSSRQKLLMSFAHWFERDWAKNVSTNYHSPEDILRSVQQLNPMFAGYQQQDSQEFLRCVLDNMHEELRREVPDDLARYLSKNFGIEGVTEAASSSSAGPGPGLAAAPAGVAGSAGSQAAAWQRGSGFEEDVGALSSGKPAPPAASATRQLMQFCQATEEATDVGEITVSGTSGLSDTLPRGRGAPTASASVASSFIAGAPATPEVVSEPSSGSCGSGSGASGVANPNAGGKGEEEEEKTHFSSIVSELFQGRLVSTVRCLECSKMSKTEEMCYDVSVPIPAPGEVSGADRGDFASLGGSSEHAQMGAGFRGVFGGLPGKVKGWFYDKGVDLSDCLRKHCAAELLAGRDRYFCERCKRKCDGEKTVAFKELPEVLCIHLKRFRYEGGWFNGTKNSKVVNFPVGRHLDMAGFMESPTAQPVEYKLVGLIQHIGSMGGGHYIAYCQHKKRPGEWYEFDDLQVNLVSLEQVERSEPYVLFYQRLPSKGCKLDRHNFKSEQRRVEAQIKAHLETRARPSTGTAEGDEGAPRAQAPVGAADELRLNGPALRNLYRNPPEELDLVFISKHWYVRLTTLSQPGPVDNFEYLCPHGLLGASSPELAAEPFMPMSRRHFSALARKYGGGPPLSSLEICPQCQAHLRAYNDRKQAEFDLVQKYDSKDPADGKYWYIVDALWVNSWKRYIRAEHVTDIRDMCAPGKITNERLFEPKTPEKLRDNLKVRVDYIGVNARVWWLFMHVHGGGPAIVREDLDIYSGAAAPDVNLMLEELKSSPGSSRDFARRLSSGFVDGCKGNLDLYEQQYGGVDTDALPDAEMRGGDGAPVAAAPPSPSPSRQGQAAAEEEVEREASAAERRSHQKNWNMAQIEVTIRGAPKPPAEAGPPTSPAA